MMDYNEKVQQIKEKVGEKSISINRVPKDTKTRFKEIASDEFEDDYGMTLAFILRQSDEYQKVKEFILSTKFFEIIKNVTNKKKM